MTGRVLLLVHDEVPGRGAREVGSVPAVLTGMGLDTEVATFLPGGPRPGPAAEFAAVVVFGSADAADDDTLAWLAPERAYLAAAIERELPVLGICFGAQLLSRVLGGTVGRAAAPEHGFVPLTSKDPSQLPDGVWMQFHDDTFTLPPGAELLAANEVGVQAFRHGRTMGVQFHPEITPAAFAAWADGWRAAGSLTAVAAAVDLPALAAEVEDRTGPAAAACHDLVRCAFPEFGG